MAVGIALFGIGRAGMIHFRNLVSEPRADLRYIVEKDFDKARDLIQRYRLKECRVVDPDQVNHVYLDESVQAVFVCAPTYAHEDIVRSALQHGKGVFCEKPIGHDIEGTRLCYEEAERVNKPLLCSFNRRFDPSLSALRRRVLAGELGTIHTLKSCSRDSPLPPLEYLKTSGGIFHDCAVHDIDIICWTLQEYPTSVYTSAHAHLKEIADMDDVDTVAIVMTFGSGAIASIDLARNAIYGYDQRFEVFGSEGMLASTFQHPTGLVSYNTRGTHSDCLKASFQQRYSESYVAAMEHFLDVMLGKAKVSVSAENTLKVSKIATACQKSHKLGQPVTLHL